MELKLPFKLRVKYLNANEGGFQGKAVFHDIEYTINIHGQANEKIIKAITQVMGRDEETVSLVQYQKCEGTIEGWLRAL